LQPPLKSRKVYTIQLCHQCLGTLAVHVCTDGPLSNLSVCDSHTQIVTKILPHVNLKML
jgi:hypothetical protein